MAEASPAPPAHEDVDTCRICSMPGEDDRPLFYPCKCSGTIKYIHQDCLTTWLEHSKKRSCDVCKYRYSFTNVYSTDMPQRLPIHLVAKRVARQLVAAVVVFLRASLVSLIWLAVVPYTTVLTWRTYFWFGDVIAWWINARPKPEPLTPPLGTLAWLGNLTTFLIDADADPAALRVSRETAQVVARTISSDIFTGQIIASMIVLVFLCAFLLREWIMQNARPGLFEEERAAEEVAGLAAAGVAAPLPEPQPQPAPLPAPVPQDQVPPPALRDPPRAAAPAPGPAPPEVALPPRPPSPAPEPPEAALPSRSPSPPPRRATPIPRSPAEPVPRLVFASPPGEAGPSHPRQRRRSPSPSSSHASSVYPLSESESEHGAEDEEPSSSSPSKDWAPKIPLERSSPLREHRKGKGSQKESFVASREAWQAFQAKRGDASQSAEVPRSGSVGSFEWPSVQDAPRTPLSALSSGIPYPLRATEQEGSAPTSAAVSSSALVPYSPAASSATGLFSPASSSAAGPFSPVSSSALAPHSAATTSSPVVDLDAGRSPIPPFTPSAFQFTVESPEIPNPFVTFQQRVANKEPLWETPISAFSPSFPRSDASSSPAFEGPSMSPIAPFTPSSGDERVRRPFARTWDSAPSLSAASSSSGAPSPFPPEPVASSSDAPIPPFTPSLFTTFQGVGPPPPPPPPQERRRPIAVPGRQFAKRSPLGRTPSPAVPEFGAPESAGADKFTFTFAQDQPGSATFSMATAGRRPSLAPATPSEEIPIALYRAPEDLGFETFAEERRKRQRSYTDMELDLDQYFRPPDAADADAPQPAQGPVREGPQEDDLPLLVDVTDQSDSDFEEHVEDVDDDENEEEWEDMIDGDDAMQQLLPEDEAGEDMPPVDEPAPVDPNVDEDLDGALEAVGMRGPVVIVFQNAAIASVLLDLAIAIGIWWPYTVGKTLGLITLNPRRGLTLLNMPIRAVRVVSDPIVDLVVYLVVKVFASTLLIIPRVLRLGLIGIWLLSSRLFMRAGDLLLRIAAFVPGLAAALPAAGDRARLVRKTDAVVFRILRPDFSALLRRVTALLPAAPTGAAVGAELSSNQTAVSTADWLIEVAQKLPVGSDYAQERVQVWNAFAARFATRWTALVEGDGTVERLLAVALGYFLFLLAAASYLHTFSSANARNAGRAVRNVIRQQLVVIKVAMFIVIELIMFPVGCGLLLDLCTMPMFPDASVSSRVTFFKYAPLTSTFSHWLLGTTFMYQFAIMLSTCRTLMRPGAMWFVKDPQDPAAHPIRDIIDRPATSQIKKLSISVVMYTIVIGVGVGCMVWIMLVVSADLFPLRWNLREPLSDVPIDLLFAHLVLPPTLKYMRVRATFRAFLEQWWRFTSRQLRLSSFMYGGRHDAEEYTPTKWSLAALFYGNRPRPEGVARDGEFRRVPANDNVALPTDRKTVVRVDEQGNALTEEGAAVIEAQIAQAEEARRDPKLDYTIVYVPPHFGWRMLVFMAFFWMTTVIVVLFGLSFPIRVGRAIIALATDRILHDVYAFTIGAYALAGGWLIGTELPAAARPWTFIRQVLLWAPKAAYMTLMIGFVLPTLTAVAVELYIVLPLRMWFFPNTQPVIRIVHCWAVGLILGRIVLRTQRVRRAQRQPPEQAEGEQDEGIMRAWYQIERNGLLAPDVVAATRNFIMPVLSGLISTISIPALAFVLAQKLMPVPIPAKLLPQIVYILIFSLVAGSTVVGNLFDSTSSWMQAVRDQEFLVERRLRNLEARKEAKPAAAAPAPAPVPAA